MVRRVGWVGIGSQDNYEEKNVIGRWFNFFFILYERSPWYPTDTQNNYEEFS